jgi:hypothetical protein
METLRSYDISVHIRITRPSTPGAANVQLLCRFHEYELILH